MPHHALRHFYSPEPIIQSHDLLGKVTDFFFFFIYFMRIEEFIQETRFHRGLRAFLPIE